MERGSFLPSPLAGGKLVAMELAWACGVRLSLVVFLAFLLGHSVPMVSHLQGHQQANELEEGNVLCGVLGHPQSAITPPPATSY